LHISLRNRLPVRAKCRFNSRLFSQ
jgi:hypothetical protein